MPVPNSSIATAADFSTEVKKAVNADTLARKAGVSMLVAVVLMVFSFIPEESNLLMIWLIILALGWGACLVAAVIAVIFYYLAFCKISDESCAEIEREARTLGRLGDNDEIPESVLYKAQNKIVLGKIKAARAIQKRWAI